MDPLLDRINVRDLLSGHDLSDPSTPLSAPDLRLLINRLESHSIHIKSKVRSYILSHHDDFASLFSRCSDAVLKTDQISDNLTDILSLISDHPIDVEIRELVDEIGRKKKEAREKKELLGLLRIVVGICEKLEGARSALRNGRLVFAAEEINELKRALRIDDVEDGEPIVYGILRNQWADLFDEMQELLAKCVENAIKLEQDSRTVRVKFRLSVDGIDGILELHKVLEAMHVAGILGYGLAKAADLIIKHVFTPAVNYASPITFQEDIEQGSEGITEAILKMSPSPDDKIVDANGDAIYARVIQVIRFIFKHVCFENGSWIHSFGRLTWPRVSDLIISNFLSKVVPEDASKLAEFQKTIIYTSEFESSLKEMMYISASDNEEKLSNFAENVEVHFAVRKRTEILGKARNLLMQCDFSIPREYTTKGRLVKNVGMTVNSFKQVVDLLFSSERCVVSKAASLLMELVHQTLKDVCLSSTRVALELYHSARDAILLYETIVPVKLEKQLDGFNQVAVLMHNDCLYLSQEILGLAFEYHSDFPEPIKEHAIFADMAPRFHLMAEEILQRQIQLVIYNLREAIDGANGFQNTHQMQQFESAKFSIDQVVFVLEKVHIIWEPLLLPSTYKRSMCLVLESVFSRITKDILLLDDLAADETLQLQRLIHLMLENLSSILKSLESSEDSKHRIHDLIPSLRKIHKLAELLDMPLKSITAAWESGELITCGFTVVELKDFIMAVFADSPLRKECLWRIENVGLW